MDQPNLFFDCSEIGRLLSNYAIGFARITVDDGVEDTTLIGSGTLITIDNLHGVVTARHVIDELKRNRQLGIIRSSIKSDELQALRVDTEKLEYLPLPGANGPLGPDLGFIRLPLSLQEALLGTSSFYPLSTTRPAMKDSYKGLGTADLVLGFVSEWTIEIELSNERRLKKYNLMLDCGVSGQERDNLGFDIFTFTPAPDPDIAPPRSYGGVSGGGIWRVFFRPDGSNFIEHHRLVGTAFYEQDPGDGIARILHHGPRALKCKLMPAVRARWPNAVEV